MPILLDVLYDLLNLPDTDDTHVIPADLPQAQLALDTNKGWGSCEPRGLVVKRVESKCVRSPVRFLPVQPEL